MIGPECEFITQHSSIDCNVLNKDTDMAIIHTENQPLETIIEGDNENSSQSTAQSVIDNTGTTSLMRHTHLPTIGNVLRSTIINYNNIDTSNIKSRNASLQKLCFNALDAYTDSVNKTSIKI